MDQRHHDSRNDPHTVKSTLLIAHVELLDDTCATYMTLASLTSEVSSRSIL